MRGLSTEPTCPECGHRYGSETLYAHGVIYRIYDRSSLIRRYLWALTGTILFLSSQGLGFAFMGNGWMFVGGGFLTGLLLGLYLFLTKRSERKGTRFFLFSKQGLAVRATGEDIEADFVRPWQPGDDFTFKRAGPYWLRLTILNNGKKLLAIGMRYPIEMPLPLGDYLRSVSTDPDYTLPTDIANDEPLPSTADDTETPRLLGGPSGAPDLDAYNASANKRTKQYLIVAIVVTVILVGSCAGGITWIFNGMFTALNPLLSTADYDQWHSEASRINPSAAQYQPTLGTIPTDARDIMVGGTEDPFNDTFDLVIAYTLPIDQALTMANNATLIHGQPENPDSLSFRTPIYQHTPLLHSHSPISIRDGNLWYLHQDYDATAYLWINTSTGQVIQGLALD